MEHLQLIDWFWLIFVLCVSSASCYVAGHSHGFVAGLHKGREIAHERFEKEDNA